MSTCRLLLICSLLVGLASCSGGGPSESEREHAFLQFVKANGSDDARIEDFNSKKCQKAEGAPSFVCDASAKVHAMGRDFGNQMDGVYTFTLVDDRWQITGRVQ